MVDGRKQQTPIFLRFWEPRGTWTSYLIQTNDSESRNQKTPNLVQQVGGIIDSNALIECGRERVRIAGTLSLKSTPRFMIFPPSTHIGMNSFGSRAADRNEFAHEMTKNKWASKITFRKKHDAEVHRKWIFPEPCAKRCESSGPLISFDGLLFHQWDYDRQEDGWLVRTQNSDKHLPLKRSHHENRWPWFEVVADPQELCRAIILVKKESVQGVH
jgi:hypothetical protein